MSNHDSQLRIGWAQTDITPQEPVLVTGQFSARVSEEVLDPITGTALVLDSGADHVVFLSCDVVGIADPFRDAILERLPTGLAPEKVVINATHTHTGPEIRLRSPSAGHTSANGPGVDLPVMEPEDYIAFAAERLAAAIGEAWATRAPGKVAWGIDYAVVGHNRRWVDASGRSTMYGNTAVDTFSHIEGYADHSVNVLATYGMDGALTGAIVNIPCPSQETESLFALSADYWHEVRVALRSRFGDALFVLPQCSAAGDQSPHLIYDKAAHQRMAQLRGQSNREIIGDRIAYTVGQILDVINAEATGQLPIQHVTTTLDLPLSALTEEDRDNALAEAEKLDADKAVELQRLENHPELKEESRWYTSVTTCHQKAAWFRGAALRYEEQRTCPTRPYTIHTIRLGEIAFSTSPFEYYLDYGIAIKARSPFVQTFLIQLAGSGTYVPSPRSLAGGGYGSVPASNPIGPEGGRMVAEEAVRTLKDIHGA
jgi:hypothetical protein